MSTEVTQGYLPETTDLLKYPRNMEQTAVSITLKPELEKRVQEKVRSGAYRSPEEVILAGLSLLESRDQKLEALRADLQIGLDQLDQGEGIDAELVFAELESKYADTAR
jgi:antitoxin ParD1/3/4